MRAEMMRGGNKKDKAVMWGRRRGGDLQCSRVKISFKLPVSLLAVSPFRPVVQVNFSPCAALVQQRALGDNPAQLGPSLPLLSSPQ